MAWSQYAASKGLDDVSCGNITKLDHVAIGYSFHRHQDIALSYLSDQLPSILANPEKYL